MCQFQVLMISYLWLSVAAFGRFVLLPPTTRGRSHNFWNANLRPLQMVRNIDLPEAIVFYGAQSLMDVETQEPLPGVEALLKECQEIDAAALLLLYDESSASSSSESSSSLRSSSQDKCIKRLQEKYGTTTLSVHIDTDHPPPNPRALYEAIESTLIQPKGFGGSSGFGTKLAEPERNPLPKHVVVLAHTDDQCRAARFFGARVMSLVDNDFADGILLDWSEIGVDDISTPGSYWLNPPPGSKDDEGNKVDMFEVMDACESSNLDSDSEVLVSATEDEVLSEEALNAILNDMDPL
eukprot:CAMPEP_0119004698 /NCGR_PEP_ID=MMETSP1176-20130426/1294_1 /TAXON_ID=265551 /ORGANISM="Synedropsis recta cf, Strain CCMP1620" /LENGTH=294 /DNA_ID=CAMNT_0006956433 /DNA_START=130 /DNA_END=1014 /DNA_ORIENTATION=-